MRAALCPGSFDPPTNGHIDVIERAARHFDHVIAAVIANPSKEPLLSLEDRKALLSEAIAHIENASVDSFDGLLVDFANARGVSVIVKGLRAVSDYEYELQMAQMNAALLHGLDTLFLPSKPDWSFLSSSLVKQVARYGGGVDGLVPVHVAKALKQRYAAS
ncbi:MAG: pantetheine-phosphate adenylyltransferase [Actinomycetota bacterium]